MSTILNVRVERWPIRGSFRIARGAKTEAVVVFAELTWRDHQGHGECVPYARYGESPEGVADTLSSLALDVKNGMDRIALQDALPPGAARNALDCAFWDFEAKRTRTTVAALLGLGAQNPVQSAYTLSLDTPEDMATAAREAAKIYPLLKIKLGADGDAARLAAIRAAAPDVRLIVDANEGWTGAALSENLAACAACGVELIEQPLPADDDAALYDAPAGALICADESIHGLASLAHVMDRYSAINIKLDKTGGLTEALALMKAARAADMKVMVGCMLATSLAMAPAVILAQSADYVDLDGPLLLAQDRKPGLAMEGGLIEPPSPRLWG